MSWDDTPGDPGGPDGDDFYLPFSGARRGSNEAVPDDLEDFDEDLSEELEPAAMRLRPPPEELSRRDRREWSRLEVARINRAAQTVVSRHHNPVSAGWSGGFIKNPPRGLGRKGRKAWLVAEQEATTQWWAQRRASSRDADARAAGAAVLALVIGIAVVVALVMNRSDSTGSAAASATSAASPTPTPAGSVASAAADRAAPAPVVPGATGVVAVASANHAVGATPTVPPPVAGRWQPTPAGGVPAVTPVSPTPADPAGVRLVPAPTGPVTAADQATAAGVVAAWLARTCPSSWRDRFGADRRRGQALETIAAWTVDDPARDTAGAVLWQRVALAHQQARRCGNLTVTLSPDQPLTAGGGFVLYSADRVVTSAAGQVPPAVEHLFGARRVIRAGGKWQVDIPVVGG